ncbi:hypothetical protein [Agrobacterium tumefaciens]|uniref:hypothetical protein n=1 Tax=Agrobacterium tumefaciens TaxID=358 RepID=UPI0021D36E70|nr:hypothetical protein [Agrobacterium tumefaciens]
MEVTALDPSQELDGIDLFDDKPCSGKPLPETAQNQGEQLTGGRADRPDEQLFSSGTETAGFQLGIEDRLVDFQKDLTRVIKE